MLEVASIFATIAADVTPLESSLTAADNRLKLTADQATLTTDVVAGLGVGAGLAAGGIEGLQGAAGGATTTIGGLAAGVEGAAVAEGALVASSLAAAESEFTLSGALDAVKGASLPLIGELGVLAIAGLALKGVYDQTVGSAITLGQETRTLGLSIGATAEQSGKLVFAAESVGVSFQQLNQALDQAINKLKTARSDGIQPNIEGIGKLSDAYLALAPGVDRTTFLLDNFGRAGANMAPLMALGSAGIKALGDQATATGNVLSGPASDKVHAFDLWVTKLGEDAKGTAVQLGLLAIGADGLSIAHGLLTDAKQKGLITEAQAQIMLQEAIDGAITYTQVIDDTQAKLTAYSAMTVDLANGTTSSGNSMVAAATDTQSLVQAFGAATLAGREHILAVQKVKEATNDLTLAQTALSAAPKSDVLIDAYYKSATALDTAQTALNKLDVAQSGLTAHGPSLVTNFSNLTGLALDNAIANAKVTDATNKLADARAALAANSDPSKQDALTTAVDNSAAALNAETDAADKTAQAITDLNNAAADAELKAGLAGKLGAATASYAQVFTDTTPKLAKLQEELARYEALQGKTITTTTAGKISQEDYQVAVERTALAHAKYDAALQGTIDKHGKLHMVSALTIEGMRITAEAADNSLADMSTQLGTTSTRVADYSTQIGKLKTAIDPLVDTESKAEAAIRKTAEAMVYATLAADPSMKNNVELMTATARSMGVLSEADYQLTVREQYLKTERDSGVITAGQYAQAMVDLATSYSNYQVAVAKDPTTALPSFDPWAKQSEAALAAVKLSAGDMWTTMMNPPTMKLTVDPGTTQQVLDDMKKKAPAMYAAMTDPVRQTVATVDVTVVPHVADAITKADELQTKLTAMHDRQLIIDANNSKAINSIDAVVLDMQALKDKTITITTVYNDVHNSIGGGSGGSSSQQCPIGSHWDGRQCVPDGKALGGPVESGQAGLVGERGPELFVPQQSGVIVPNGQSRGGGNTYNYNTTINDKLAAALYLEMQRQQTLARHESLMS